MPGISKRVAIAAVSLQLFAGASLSQAQDDQIGIAVGERPPPVTIEDLDGNPVDLSDYVGRKPVVLQFWATWCPLCKALEPRMLAASAKHGERVEFLIVAVAVNQTQRRVRRHLERNEVAGRVLWDTDGRAVRAFMAPSTSYVVVLDAEGRVAYTGLGEDQDIEAAIERALESEG